MSTGDNAYHRRRHPDPFSDRFWAEIVTMFGLSGREKEVLRLLCCGFSNFARAEMIGVTYPTLRSHVRSICHKLGCADRVDIILTLLELEREKTCESSLGMIASAGAMR